MIADTREAVPSACADRALAFRRERLLGIGEAVRLPWGDKPAYVEWDRTGDADGGYGAVIYLAAAPMVLVHEILPRYRSDRDITEAVEAWAISAGDRYRLNEEYEQFKAVARKFEDDGDTSRGYFV